MRIIYDAISPITGNQCVLQDYDPETRDFFCLCTESGYYTYRNAYKENSELNNFIQSTDKTYASLGVKDSSGTFWYPTTENRNNYCLYPIITSENKLTAWGISKVVNIADFEIHDVISEKFNHDFKFDKFIDAFNEYNRLENE